MELSESACLIIYLFTILFNGFQYYEIKTINLKLCLYREQIVRSMIQVAFQMTEVPVLDRESMKVKGMHPGMAGSSSSG